VATLILIPAMRELGRDRDPAAEEERVAEALVRG
jgi:hypothetical protein